ncbi:MAG: helix-turn-helix transcriptional regulator, partial [Polaromonas sp.]
LDTERKRRGLTLTDVINQANVSRAAVYRLFKGGDVQLTTLLAVTNLLGLDMVAMPSRITALLPDAGTSPDGGVGAFRTIQQTEAVKDAAKNATNGPLSAVAARAARIEGRLQQGTS